MILFKDSSCYHRNVMVKEQMKIDNKAIPGILEIAFKIHSKFYFK